MYRIGIIEYINSIPFAYGLEQFANIHKDTPRNLAHGLINNRFDAAFVPVVEYLRNKELYTLIDGVSISSIGATHSVFIACKRVVQDVRCVQESVASMSSNFVSRIVLKERYGITPVFFTGDTNNPNIDARIIIGDTALSLNRTVFVKVLDVGAEWYSLTGLPMVYAVCVTKDPALAEPIGRMIKDRFDANYAQLDTILLSVHKQKYSRYLHSLNYELSPTHTEAIETIHAFMKKEYTLCHAKS